MAFDVSLGCSGFIYGLAIAGALIETGLAHKGLLICSEATANILTRRIAPVVPLQ
jgi:3-oxoacyl-[acyl-carrier-protein] synthase-3